MTTPREEALNTPNSAYPNLEERLDTYMRRIFYLRDSHLATQEHDPAIVEYFGVLSLTNVRAPRRKLWYMYYATADELDATVDQIHKKYGQKNMYDLYRKPVFSGSGMRARVKNHFSALKWYVKGNILEAPPDSPYNDEKVVNTIADLYQADRRRYHDLLVGKNSDFVKWNPAHLNC
ncbi:uncharacterized protein Dana_GF13526 [Drosophila ananassae]|uniref:Uncharacterized protein n=1 Tax=Drosophila ananassae TaxID=7217 RepID=B3MEH1_DROAN|nr:uncharacterized protein LOC6496365 [Drosophila ananassae]EDV37591.1 uncharacterized protein Dana_GF13526 [Drosophila ananassae]